MRSEGLATNRPELISFVPQSIQTMKYAVFGHNVSLEFEGEEITEIIESLELTNPQSELLAAFQQYRNEEFAQA